MSRASIAALALAEGKPSEAEELARQAADAFQQEKLVDQEADARNVVAKALIAEGKISDAQTEANQAMSLSPQDRAVRLSLGITAARLKARAGNTADAKKDLDGYMTDAVKMKLVGTTFDVTLAETELLAASDPKSALARLQTLAADAKAKGYLEVAAEAERARAELLRALARG